LLGYRPRSNEFQPSALPGPWLDETFSLQVAAALEHGVDRGGRDDLSHRDVAGGAV
jgi:hypothetical protein